MRRSERWVWIVTGLALLLRLPRAISRWDEIALAYAAYWEPSARYLREWELGAALTEWTGLHPPLYGVLLGASEIFVPFPFFYLLLSVSFSTLAVFLVGRVAGPFAALVLATSPLQISYAAELNNYPLATFCVAACVWSTRRNWRWVALTAVIAAWSHVLAAVGAAGLLWTRSKRDGLRRSTYKMIAAAGLGILPIGVGVLRLLGDDGTFGQQSMALVWIASVVESIGIEGLLMSVLAWRAWRDPASWVWLAMASTLAGTLLLGITSSEQLQYLPLLGPPMAVLIARGLESTGNQRSYRWLVAAVILCCTVRAARVVVDEQVRISEIVADQNVERAIDLAVEASREGDTLWLVSPANQADDDKTATAPVLWRISPMDRMPMANPVSFEYRDYRYGQPRSWRERVVHTSTELYAGPFDSVATKSLADGNSIWVVVYEYEQATGLIERIERVLRPYDFELAEVPTTGSVERLYRIDSLIETGVEP